ncbi:glycosyltransferase family 1 protein [Luteolibacter yonseiensis]|uniref:Glycosyltransferase family 1 protein n=1 Tax=Luteolibacter yonseiensis TaxID=1144680 RepID=A0A934R791_9BACT|nr:glycosyltransferase family 1 protein [Luteolibacter yonseiensis]MBK1816394.1 glycosyltransferase family 1 protein [Luteolibacter yonseiensis]
MTRDLMMREECLHIEVVTDTYAPDVNGVAFSLHRLCSGLRELGHEVEVIRSGRACGPGETTVFSWPLPGYWEIKVGAPLPGELFRRWRKKRPDVVYVAIETPLGFSAAGAAIRLGIPLVGGFHTNFREYLQKYGVDWVGRQVWLYQKWFHERLHRTLVPSPDARDKLVASGFTKVAVLGRGVDTRLFNPGKRSEEFRRKFGAQGALPIALVVGRVSTEKNIGLALRAFTRMRETCPDMVCIVVGDGPARARLERDHPEVRFSGYLLGEELATCYASADIMLFPSETETFGNVLIEGMASGLATLGYDYAAAGWHGTDGGNLLKVEKGDETAFLAAAERLLDPDLRAKLSAGALETAGTLGWPGIVSQLETVFREVTLKP